MGSIPSSPPAFAKASAGKPAKEKKESGRGKTNIKNVAKAARRSLGEGGLPYRLSIMKYVYLIRSISHPDESYWDNL